MPKLPRNKPSGGSFAGRYRQVPTQPLGKPFQLDVENFYLRSLSGRDANQELVSWMNDPDVLAGLNMSALNFNLQQLQQNLDKCDNRRRYFIGIFVKPKMKLIGFFELTVDLQHRTASMAAGIGDKAWWGKGVIRQVTMPMIQHFFTHRNIDKASYRITSENRRIIFSILGTKFKHEGTLEKQVLTPDGRRIDVYVFGLVKKT